MKLDVDRANLANQHNSLDYTWVKLWQLPSPFSFEEALLLCPLSHDQWLAWIPDHGEAVLRINY
jgi:hypothetical protein